MNPKVQAFLDSKPPDGPPTWRAWLRALLNAIYDGASRKRPLGSSDWEYFLDMALKEHDITFMDVLDAMWPKRSDE